MKVTHAMRTFKPDPVAAAPLSLADLVARAATMRNAAVAADPDIARLRARLPDIEARKEAAEQELQRLLRLRSEASDASARKLSVQAEANALLAGDALRVTAVNDDTIRQAQRSVLVAQEALTSADQQIRNLSAGIAQSLFDRELAPALRAAQRKLALGLAALTGEWAGVFNAFAELPRSGFGSTPMRNSWMPMLMFGIPADPYSPGAMTTREAVRYGAISVAELCDALGDFPGASRVVAVAASAPVSSGSSPTPPTPPVLRSEMLVLGN